MRLLTLRAVVLLQVWSTSKWESQTGGVGFFGRSKSVSSAIPRRAVGLSSLIANEEFLMGKNNTSSVQMPLPLWACTAISRTLLGGVELISLSCYLLKAGDPPSFACIPGSLGSITAHFTGVCW